MAFSVHIGGKQPKQTNSIAHFIQGRVIVLYQDATSEQAAHAMYSNGVGSVVVNDHDGRFVGIVTDRDLTCRLVAYGLPGTTPLYRIMTSQPAYVTPEASVESVIRLMEENGVRRIPVIHTQESGRQQCVGIISLDDLVVHEEIAPARMKRIVRGQILRRLRTSGLRKMIKLQPVQPHMQDAYYLSLMNAIQECTSLDADAAHRATRIIIESVARRLHYTGAMHLISTLPPTFQRELANLAPGPDSSITVDRIVARLQTELAVLRNADARAILERICGTLADWIGDPLTTQIQKQLPTELRTLFTPTVPPSETAA